MLTIGTCQTEEVQHRSEMDLLIFDSCRALFYPSKWSEVKIRWRVIGRRFVPVRETIDEEVMIAKRNILPSIIIIESLGQINDMPVKKQSDRIVTVDEK